MTSRSSGSPSASRRERVRMSRSSVRTGKPSTRFTGRRSLPEALTTAFPACVSTTTRRTTAPSFTTSMGTTSRPSATPPAEGQHSPQTAASAVEGCGYENELFAICVPCERLGVDKPSERLASVSHSRLQAPPFLPWAGVTRVIAADDLRLAPAPSPSTSLQRRHGGSDHPPDLQLLLAPAHLELVDVDGAVRGRE